MPPTSTSDIWRSWAILPAVLGLLGCARHGTTGASAAGSRDATAPVPDIQISPGPRDAADQASPEWILFDDFEGGSKFTPSWAVIAAGPRQPAIQEDLVPPRQTSRRAMHLQGDPSSAAVDTNVHHHFNWWTLFSGVRFWARSGGRTSELLVALTDIRSGLRSFHEDEVDGRPWKVKRVSLGPEWRSYTIAFDDLSAETPGMPTAFYGPGEGAQAGSELHFVLPPNVAYDVWVDDVELRCRPETCASIVFGHSP